MDWPYPIYSSQRVNDRRSIFLAHASALPNSALFPEFLNHLTSSPQLKRATHCMYAYRTSDPPTSLDMNTKPKLITAQHDGGESGAGNHLARLLELTGCENVVVVVSRWYGGTPLGSDRWRRISEVAKEALNQGEFMIQKKKEEVKTASKKSEKGKRRRK